MGNLRTPSMRISSEHVAGVLKFLDQRAEAKAAPVAPTPPLRFPQDFPGARPTLQRDLKLLDDHGSNADVMIELDALYEESAAAMIASAEGIEAADKQLADVVDIPLPAPKPIQEEPQLALVPAEQPFQPAKRVGKAAAQERLQSAARITTKAPRPTPAFISRPDPMTVRRERLTKAIGWLKREHRILVSVVDRDAALRTYSVSGKRYTMLADHVIDYAVALGMAIDG